MVIWISGGTLISFDTSRAANTWVGSWREAHGRTPFCVLTFPSERHPYTPPFHQSESSVGGVYPWGTTTPFGGSALIGRRWVHITEERLVFSFSLSRPARADERTTHQLWPTATLFPWKHRPCAPCQTRWWSSLCQTCGKAPCAFSIGTNSSPGWALPTWADWPRPCHGMIQQRETWILPSTNVACMVSCFLSFSQWVPFFIFFVHYFSDIHQSHGRVAILFSLLWDNTWSVRTFLKFEWWTRPLN